MIKNSESGVSLIITFFVLVIILAVVLSISVILYSELKIIRNIGDSVVAFYAADSGVEKTLYYDRQILPEGMAGSMHGICNICNSCPATECSDCIVPATEGCNPLTCENCEVTFNSDLLGGKTYKVTARVSQVSSQDDPPLQFSNLNIDSVGSYNSVLGADAVKRAIEINMQKDYAQPPPPALSVSVVAQWNNSPNPAYVGDQVTFFALPLGGTEIYSYSWAISPSGSCSNGNTSQICTAIFASAGQYTATVTVEDSTIPTPQTAIASASVTVIVPWTCGIDRLVDIRDSKTYATVQIGSQCWMAENINIGTRILGSSNQGSSCSAIKKYCFGNSESRCTSYGGLYQWGQVMCGSTTAGVQGICPTGWHIPTHNEFTTLERAICTSPTCSTDFPYDITTDGLRGTNEGTTLKTVNPSSFSALLAGFRDFDGGFYYLGNYTFFWSSFQSGPDEVWYRNLGRDWATVNRDAYVNIYGYSVRCLKD